MFQPINYLAEHSDYLSYLPEFYLSCREFQEIANTVNTEIDVCKERILILISEQYIKTAELTLKNREEEFGIIAGFKETLELRRQRLIAGKSRKPPVTIKTLRETVENYTNYAEVSLVPGEYAFRVAVPAADSLKYNEIIGLVNKLKPANMELEFVFLLPFNAIGITGDYKRFIFNYLFAAAALHLCGTKPDISTKGRVLIATVNISGQITRHLFSYRVCGIEPRIATIGKIHVVTMEIAVAMRGSVFVYPPCGTLLSGIYPS